MEFSAAENIRTYYDEKTKILKMPDSDIEIPKEGMGHLIYESLKENSKSTALIDIEKDETITYEELRKRCVRTALKLKQLNVQPGDIISIFSHNQIDSIAVFFSAFLGGFINASLDPALPDDDLAHLIKQVDTKVYFVSEQAEERLRTILEGLNVQRKIVVFGKSAQSLAYEEFVMEQEGEEDFVAYATENLDEMCLIMFSSGTTGYPKGMVLSHRFFVYHTYFKIDFAKIIMTISHIYWIGAIQTALTQIRWGRTYVYGCTFKPRRFFAAIDQYKIQLMQFHPHAALEFVEEMPENWAGKLEALLLVGSSISNENFEKLKRALPDTFICPVYGQSETLVTLTPDEACSKEKMGSCGQPKNNIHYKIVDVDTEEALSFNQPGELRLKSPYQITAYYKIDSSDIRDQEGYIRTGDIAYYDEDFYFYVVDRVKDIFKCRGVHINPVKYERVLETHAGVREAVLIGIPHDYESTRIMAVVVAENEAVSAEEIVEFYNGRVIDAARIKAGVKFVEEIPRNNNGKILRRKLLETALQEFNAK